MKKLITQDNVVNEQWVQCLNSDRLNLREGNGTPLQYSYLENPIDGGAWWAAVFGVTQSQI